MLYKTRGIVFRFTKYGETSIIVNIFTDVFGLQGYIINGVRSKAAKSKIALYQPLTLLDMVVYHREHANINRIKEVRCLQPFHSIAVNVKKSAIAIFINEIINKTIKEESHSKEIFEFLYLSISTLDALQDGYESFHLLFLLKLSRYLGFGAHTVSEVLGLRVSDSETEKLIEHLISSEYEQTVILSNDQRRILLELIIKFYADHIDTLGEIRSVQVLKEIMMG